MKKEIPKLKFKGKKYLLISKYNSRKQEAIATKEQWETLSETFAHLFF